MTITSYGYAGTIGPAPVWAKLQRALNHMWFVDDANDLAVSANTGAVRTVTVGPGVGGGAGIYNYNDGLIQVPLGAPVSGTKWYLIALREDMAGHVSTVVAIDCGTSKYAAHSTAVPLPVLQQNEAGLWDVPLALVEVSSTTTTPTAIIDLRLVGVHGGNYFAADENVLQYAVSAGIEINVNGRMWRRIMAGASSTTWQTELVDTAPVLSNGASVVDSTTNGWTVSGVLQEAWNDNGQLDLYVELRRTGAALAFGAQNGHLDDLQVCTLDARVRPKRPVDVQAIYITSSNSSYGATVSIEPSGAVILKAGALATDVRKSTDATKYDLRVTASYNLRRSA